MYILYNHCHLATAYLRLYIYYYYYYYIILISIYNIFSFLDFIQQLITSCSSSFFQ